MSSSISSHLSAIGFSMDSFEEIFFFSDSINDLPLLEIVHKPVAVNPDPKLLAHAQSKGWEVLQLHVDD